ncbi:MAG TPA: hypothetical protein VIQ22_02280 [Gammaproteobacteria bacterium]
MTQPSILGRWYADPLSPDEARQLLKQTEQREEKRKRHGGGTLICGLQRMVARFWLGGDIADDYQLLRPAAARTAHGEALLKLVYGQLLSSRKLAAGLPHLESGFRRATSLFAAGDYLEVMNRHRLLRQLPLTDTPVPAEPLETLLTTARVIERMRQSSPQRSPYRHDPKDTYG